MASTKFAVAFMCLGWVVSCGDDGGSAAAADDAGADTTADTASGLCVGQEDALEATYGDDNQMVAEIATGCGVNCGLTDPDHFSACVTTCLSGELSTAITTDCLGCVTMSVDCSADNCVGDCLTDPLSTACTECQCGANAAMVNCRDVFNTCAGLHEDTCDML